ncbi:MAG: hypothetical protein ACTSRP_02705 [Candidatus Helarchaeota archaeon]
MSSLIRKFFEGFMFFFGKEFRYYSITFIVITIILSIASFNTFFIDPELSLSLTVLIGISFSHSFFLLALLSFVSDRTRSFLLESKWRGLIAPCFSIFGTLLFFIIFLTLMNIIFSIYIEPFIYICVYIWLAFQAIGINLMGKFTSEWFNESILEYKWKIFFVILFCVIVFILFIFVFPILNELEPLIKYVYPWYPVESLVFINFSIFISMIVMAIISLSKRDYNAGMYITGFFLIVYAYIFYLPLRILIYVESYFKNWIPAISIIDILLILGTLIYTIQSLGNFISKGDKSVLGLFFIIFAVSWIYETWFISSLMIEALYGSGDIQLTQVIISGASDFTIYVFASTLSVILGIVFYVKYLKAHR